MTAATRVVAIGGSAGAIDAVRALLRPLAANIDAAFVLVIHLPAEPPSLLPQVLGSHTALVVREALDKEPLEAGVVLVAPPDYHMLIEREGTVSLSRDPAVKWSRPAIDPLFESAAASLGARAVAVLLTGANDDGAAGLRAIRASGGVVAVQDPTTAVAADMPTAGIAAVSPDHVGSPAALGRWLAVLLAAPEFR